MKDYQANANNNSAGRETVSKHRTDRPPEPENGLTLEELSKDYEETLEPYVRYLVREDDGRQYQTELIHYDARIPDDAIAASGVYLLDQYQIGEILHGTPPKVRISQGITRDVQNQCHDDGRVVYPVVAESDALQPEDKTEAQTIIDWLITFADDWLDFNVEYELYYSGGRSIHLHTDRFVSSDALDGLQRLAEDFKEETGAKLDTGIYDKHSLFRLIGVRHRETDRYKVRIDTNVDRTDCLRAAKTAPEEKRLPYDLPPPRQDDGSLDEAVLPGSKDSSLPLSCPGKYVSGPLPPEIRDRTETWVYKGEWMDEANEGDDQTDAEPFSPYKKTSDEKSRSVIVMEQIGGLRQNRETENIYVPARIEYAVGGGDGSFIRYNSDSLVYLSPLDYQKWKHEPGDTVVIIGGRSGNSIILEVAPDFAVDVSNRLEAEGREATLKFLSDFGYEVGSSGLNPSQYDTGGKTSEFEATEAAKTKQRIDSGDYEPPRNQVRQVCCRLLKIDGWDAAWQWCQDVYGDGFDPEVTHTELSDIIEQYPDDYPHVTVPEEP